MIYIDFEFNAVYLLHTLRKTLSSTNNAQYAKIHLFLGAVSFQLRYVTLIRYIYIICVAMCNRNNEFILLFILRENKMGYFEHRQLEIGLEFAC